MLVKIEVWDESGMELTCRVEKPDDSLDLERVSVYFDRDTDKSVNFVTNIDVIYFDESNIGIKSMGSPPK